MKKLMAIVLVGMLVGGLSAPAFSWDGHYRYRDGHYYRNAGWWGWGGFATGLAIGAYAASLPHGYETVNINGIPYYYADGYYYQAGPSGYVVVAPPAGQEQDQPTSTGNNPMFYILGTLFGILLLVCIGLVLKKLFFREARPT